MAEGARRGGLAAETTDRDRVRLTEIARTMLQSGKTVRQADDHLETPTSTLRHWLREAGPELGHNGTLADPEPAPVKVKPPGGGSAVSALNELGRCVRLWDGLEALEEAYGIEAVSTPSGVTHLTFTRRETE